MYSGGQPNRHTRDKYVQLYVQEINTYKCMCKQIQEYTENMSHIIRSKKNSNIKSLVNDVRDVLPDNGLSDYYYFNGG